MKKIITALNNPKLNEKLAQEKRIKIICKDILYKDAILDVLEKIKYVDMLIYQIKKINHFLLDIRLVNLRINMKRKTHIKIMFMYIMNRRK